MSSYFLDDRGMIRVQGPEARGFLQGLVTCQMNKIAPDQPAFGALLSPQGKILYDFFIHQAGEEGFLIDVPRDLVGDLIRRLMMYRLRAKVDVSDVSQVIGVLALWGDEAAALRAQGAMPDPRSPSFGWRLIGPRDSFKAMPGQDEDASSYEARRIAFALPRGGLDFAYGETFPHEANMDRLHGLDFHKGCYVGQEVVSRVQHRGLARRRIVRVQCGDGAPDVGTPILAGESEIGVMGSSLGPLGLAMLRLDRVKEAMEQGLVVRAQDGRELSVEPIAES